jgi:hypothetical protein
VVEGSQIVNGDGNATDDTGGGDAIGRRPGSDVG